MTDDTEGFCVILYSLLQVSMFNVLLAVYSLLACFLGIFSSSWGQQSSEAVQLISAGNDSRLLSSDIGFTVLLIPAHP